MLVESDMIAAMDLGGMHIPDRAEVGSFRNGATHFHRCMTHRVVLVDIELLNYTRSRKMLIYITVTFAEETL